MTLFFGICQIKLLKQRILLLITQTHTHAPQNLQLHVRFFLRILSLEKFGTKCAAKTKGLLLIGFI